MRGSGKKKGTLQPQPAWWIAEEFREKDSMEALEHSWQNLRDQKELTKRELGH